MASNIKGITIEIDGDSTNLQKSLTEVNNKSKDLNSELKQVNNLLKFDPSNTTVLAQKQSLLQESVVNSKTKLQQLLDAQSQVEAQFKSGDLGVEKYRSFERELEATKSQLNNTEKKLKETSTQVEVSGVKAKTSSEKWGSFNTTMSGIGNITKGAAVGVAGLVASLGGLLNKSVENADSLQTMSDQTGLTAEQLQIMQYQGKGLGVSLDTMQGATVKLTKAMSAAKDGTGAQADAFKELGINVNDSSGHLKNSNDVFNEAIDKLGSVGNETERNALAMSIFGKSAEDLNPLIKTGSTGLADLANEAKNSGAVMSNQAVTGLDNFGDTIDAIKLSIQGMLGSAFGKLTPSLQELADEIKSFDFSSLTNTITFAIEHLPVIVGIVGGLVGVIGLWKAITLANNIVQGISNTIMVAKALASGGLAAAQGVLTAATGSTTAAQLLLNAAMLANPVGIVILAIVALVTAFVLLWNNCEGFRNFWIGLWDGIKAVVAAIGNWFATDFVGFFQNAWGGIKTAFSTVVGFFEGIWSGITGVFSAVGGWFSDIFTGAWNGIKSAFSAVTGFFMGIWNTITGMFGKIGSTIGNAIGNAFKTVVNSIISFAENTINGFIKAINLAIGLINLIPGVNIPKLGELKIPRLATGGVIDKATIAMIGESGKEAVVPLENNTEWIKKLAKELKSNGNNNNNSTNLQPVNTGDTYNVHVDKVVADENKELYKNVKLLAYNH